MADPIKPVRRDHRQYRSALELRLFELALAVVPRLPRRVVLFLARWSGRAAWYLAHRDRRIALANLRLAFGDSLTDRQRVRLVRQCFQRVALTALDLLWFSRDTRRRLAQYVTLDESLAKWIRQGGPYVAVTAHFGNWEMLGPFAAMQGLPLTSVAKPLRNIEIDERVTAFRTAMGQVIVPREGALRALLRVLKSKGVVALALDQDTRPADGGTFVPFFGVPVPVSNAAAMLALRLGVPVLPGFCRAEPGGYYRGYAREALMPADFAGDTEEALTARITAEIEAEIRATPDQWLWSYKRWKRRQPGFDPARYPYYADC